MYGLDSSSLQRAVWAVSADRGAMVRVQGQTC